MLAWAERYCGDPFTGSRGVTQGDPLPPTIFNMLVDAIILHWETWVTREEAVPEGFGREVQKLAALFYANAGFISSPRPSRLQEPLEILTGMFDQVSLRTNIAKTVGMFSQLLWYVGSQLVEACTIRMKGEGWT